MFSLTTACNSQIAQQIHNLSQLSLYGPLTKRSYRQKNKCSVNNLNIEDRTISEICARLKLNRTNKQLPKIFLHSALYGPTQKSVNYIPTRKFSQLSAKRTLWHESHTSSSTFSENKITVPSQILLFSNLSKKWENISPQLLVARSFKTKRAFKYSSVIAGESEQKLESFRDQLDSRFVKNVETGKIITGGNFKDILENEKTDDSQKKIKVAFAEGYVSGIASKTVNMKFIAYFRNAVFIFSFIAILVYFSRKMKIFPQSTTKEVTSSEINVTFDDVQGVEEAKEELEEVVNFLKNPQKYTNLGAELPKGVLLVGPPGTGKTLLARAVAGEAKVPFFHAAGAEFDEVVVGQGARRVRDLFANAKDKAPCVIFIDEVDSVGAKRTSSVLHPYANQTINQLLAEMDGFLKNEGVIVLAATNRRDNLDKALLRPGRFDVEIQVPAPNLAERRQMFQYYLNKIKYGYDVDIQVLARGSSGFTGADIKNVVNQAALRAATDGALDVSMMYLEQARDRVLMGPESKKRLPDENANLITAYHEGGHTIVAYFTKDSDPIHKATIIRRGAALGYTAFIPEKEHYQLTRSQMLARLDLLMGGRAAEELIFGCDKLTTGASSDLEKATIIAEQMVKNYGMSDKVGLRTFKEPSNALINTADKLSISTKEIIDSEIKILLQESYDRAKNILKTHAKEHKALSEALMKYETLDANDIKSILEGQPMNKNI